MTTGKLWRNRKERKDWARRLRSEDPGLEVVHPHAAGMDVGNSAHYVAVRPDRDPEPVRRFECFTADLYRLADWLESCGVKTVAMQSTGVYWIPLYEILEEHGFEVYLVNARHTKNLPGRKSDVQESHVNPIDNKSMNRFYPGKADGTQTERTSFLITKQVVDRCDYLIDYHGGDLDESLRPYAYWAPTGKEAQDRISKEMVLAFGLDHITIWRDRPTDLGATRYLDNTSTARGKPSIVVEAGYAGIVEADDVALLVDGTMSTMRALKMLSGDPRTIQSPVWLDRVVDVLSDGPGIWYPLVKRGTYVQEGMKIGFVTDYFGKVILEARAPVSGVILHINALPSLKKGDNIADIAAIAAHAP